MNLDFNCIICFLKWLDKIKGIKLYEGLFPSLRKSDNCLYFAPKTNLEFEKLDERLEKIVKDYWMEFLNDMKNDILLKEKNIIEFQNEMEIKRKHYLENGNVWRILNEKLPVITDSLEASKYVREKHSLEKKIVELEKEIGEISVRLQENINTVTINSQIVKEYLNKFPVLKYNKQPKNKYIVIKF